jgi:hypothetical protein
MNGFMQFLRDNKVWWITPLLLVLTLVAYLVLVDQSSQTVADEGFQYDMY